jgi:Cu2+-exporting ATPase
MEESLAKIVQLRDISQSLQKNIDRSWGLIIVPNAICVSGAFFLGFGVMHSMVFNQIGAVVALANGLLPLRKVAEAQAEKDRQAEDMIHYAEKETVKLIEDAAVDAVKDVVKEEVAEVLA